mmetsp:Transcript_25070/g.46053  ORF Transcript_25070/g.46053 Transcript_25070/m.46053 type:complete len:628 (-) Transcript_25070:4-1887(-)
MVLCCLCGVEITGPSHGARCAQCLQREVDITEGISRREHIEKCGTCGRYQKPPWVQCEPESRDLLALCLRHVRGITREHRLVDAGFIWTEPHSKELKVKLVLQKEAMAGVLVQQNLVVEIRVNDLQCPDCKKAFTKHTWESSVQVRQRAERRRTLMNLERLIIQNGAHQNLIGLEHTKEGVDFFFKRQHDAQAFVTFVKACAVVKHQDSKHLVSHNQNNNSYRFKRTTCVEVCPVCRDDLVFLPAKMAQALGGLPRLMVCTKATSVIGLVDPASMRCVEVTASEYWKRPCSVAAPQTRLTDFIVLDVIADEAAEGKADGRPRSDTEMKVRDRIHACEVEIARVADFGHNDERLIVRSHLGDVLHPGEVAQGYDLRTLNLAVGEDELGDGPPLEVYLVRRKKPEKDRHKGRRASASAAQETASQVQSENCEAVAEEGHATERSATAEQPSTPDRKPLDRPQRKGAAADDGKEDVDEEDEGEDTAALKAAAVQLFGSLGRSSVTGADGTANPESAGTDAAPAVASSAAAAAVKERSASDAASVDDDATGTRSVAIAEDNEPLEVQGSSDVGPSAEAPVLHGTKAAGATKSASGASDPGGGRRRGKGQAARAARAAARRKQKHGGASDSD